MITPDDIYELLPTEILARTFRQGRFIRVKTAEENVDIVLILEGESVRTYIQSAIPTARLYTVEDVVEHAKMMFDTVGIVSSTTKEVFTQSNLER